MPNLKCWPGAVCQITHTQKGTDVEQLLGRIVRVTEPGKPGRLGPEWVLEKVQLIEITKPARCSSTNTRFEPGDTARIFELPDAYLTPFPDLNEPSEELEDSELDSERSFEGQEPAHA